MSEAKLAKVQKWCDWAAIITTSTSVAIHIAKGEYDKAAAWLAATLFAWSAHCAVNCARLWREAYHDLIEKIAKREAEGGAE